MIGLPSAAESFLLPDKHLQKNCIAYAGLFSALSDNTQQYKSMHLQGTDPLFLQILDVSTTNLTNLYFSAPMLQQTVKMVLIMKKNVCKKRIICFRHDNFVDVNQIPVV